MSVGRREFVVGTLSSVAASQLLGCADDEASSSSDASFTHGVASGDPTQDAVILWTRALATSGDSATVEWTVASDPALTTVVKSGSATASAASDFTVKVDVTGLAAGTTYYYAFTANGVRSPIGRTRTLPSTATHARLAFTSCANYQNGYFNAYRAIANRKDLDLWIHVGDYIYEYAPGTYPTVPVGGRAHLPAKEAVTLDDYRGRYAQYRTDPDLLELHRQLPLIIIWDDHEFANNANIDGAENHDAATEGSWTDRKKAGSRAFLEWMPIRVQPTEPVAKIWRTFQFADLFDLVMLDTRIWARSPQAGNDMGMFDGTNVGTPEVWKDPNRHIVGNEQETWIEQQLATSKMRGAHWRLIGNQVMFAQGHAPLGMKEKAEYILFSDFWDGYQYDRDRVLNYIADNGVQNTVFLTGDIHSSWAMELSKNPFDKAVYDPAAGRNGVAVELVGPSVTSQALEGTPYAGAAPGLLMTSNPHVRWAEFTKKGYVLIDVDATRLQAEWWFVNEFQMPNMPAETAAKMYTVASNSARLVATDVVTVGNPNPPAAAPA